jgi:shikimate 5-dehydrogenase
MVRPITKDTVLCMGIRGCGISMPYVEHTFAVLGSGGMAKAVVAALRDAGFHATGVRPTDDQVRRASEFSRA